MDALRQKIDAVRGIFEAEGMTARVVRAFRAVVLGLYVRCGRHDLFWRKATCTPYEILVSEVMLQQTQVERVTAKYVAFLAHFPSVGALAAAPTAAVLKVWSGLGYNRRALSLKRAAEVLVKEHASVLPRDEISLQKLPGVGPYTAAAVRAFAYDMPGVVLETNIRALFLYVFFSARSDKVTDTELIPYIEKTLPHKNPRVWYWACMDAGAVLKRMVPNPSRRSSMHVRQKKFHGSLRQVRGGILRLLHAQGTVTALAVCALYAGREEQVDTALRQLVAEGFICAGRRGYRLVA